MCVCVDLRCVPAESKTYAGFRTLVCKVVVAATKRCKKRRCRHKKENGGEEWGFDFNVCRGRCDLISSGACWDGMCYPFIQKCLAQVHTPIARWFDAIDNSCWEMISEEDGIISPCKPAYRKLSHSLPSDRLTYSFLGHGSGDSRNLVTRVPPGCKNHLQPVYTRGPTGAPIKSSKCLV